MKNIFKVFYILFFLVCVSVLLKIILKEDEVASLIYQDDISVSDTRPYAVSINNNHNSWPHVGINDAYLCYELIAEGGITRILAFYKDKKLDKIGSVRSARHYFLDYILENDAIFVHYGHSPKALEDIKNLKIDNINGMINSSAFFRDKSLNKAYEHTAFTSSELIDKYIKKFNYRTVTNQKLFDYSVKDKYTKDDEISEAKEITINYSKYTNTKYVYDEENKNYIQYMSDVKQYDGLTNEVTRVKNIIIYKVENKTLDNKGRQELYNIGTGDGYYISNGKKIKIKWEKISRESKTNYYDLNGNKLVLNDGNTWIHIQPNNQLLIIK